MTSCIQKEKVVIIVYDYVHNWCYVSDEEATYLQ